MKGIILHGGYGTRLRPLTYARPKQLLPIANIPMSQYGLISLKNAGITDVAVIIGGDNSQKVKDYYGNGEKFGVNISYVTQDEPKGISHAIGLCESFIGNEKFVVFLGDNILLKEITESVKDFEKSDYDAKILLCEVSNPSQFGIADVDGNGMIKKIMEKPKNPPTNLAVIGIYFLTPVIFGIIKKLKPSWRNELEITDALQMLLESNHKISYDTITKYWKDTGTVDDIIDANKTILENMTPVFEGKKDDGVTINGKIIVGKNSMIKKGVSITGPVLIGDNCVIEGVSKIGPNVSVGNNAHIQNCTIEDSIVMDGVTIDCKITLSKSIVSYNSRITWKGEKSSIIVCEDSKLEL
ncbi:MAG: glucose-1-phosphate thymidylyltransferase [Nitrosarchaeum sp.]|nr:glucose-1-phosphate thymidylyltransferase [Nitrosarchaeum sp.]